MGHVELATPVTHIWYFKGTPSRMGQLLDISPRNLEKIIYFASFIVTDLDEDKRKEALGSMKQDVEEGIEEMKAEVEFAVAAVDEDLERQIDDLNAQYDSEIQRLTAEVQEDIKATESEAQTVRRVLEENKNQKAPDDVRLSWVEDRLVSKGEKNAAKHVKLVQPALEAKLGEFHSRLEQDKKDAEERRQASITNEKARLADRRGEAEASLDENVRAARDFFARRQNDLTSLNLHQLLSEIRYNELRETCGDILEAASGAEAVLRLIQKIDLEELAGVLRQELKANSIQRRRKAMKRLRVVE